MCSNERATVPNAAMLPYPLAALKQLNDTTPGSTTTTPAASGLLPLDHYRLQLYNYAMAERLRFTGQLYPSPLPLSCPPPYAPYGPRLHAFSMSLFHHRALQPEEPKPQHSYIGLIAMAILSHPDTKLVLSDIYQYILDNYPYFRSRGPGWRNSIRHNLSLNDCFVKAGRSANGKGHYWAIHPANVDDFKKGDFRRRKAQRKVRKHMGLAVDEEGGDSPSPPPVSTSPPMSVPSTLMPSLPALCWGPAASPTTSLFPPLGCGVTRKRQFDVASLLAPDEDGGGGRTKTQRRLPPVSSGEEDNGDEDIDVVTSEDHESARESPPVSRGTQRLSPIMLPAWTPQGTAMFQTSGLEQQLVARYYEQLAAAQQQQHRRFLLQQQGLGSPTIVSLSSDNENSHNPPDSDDVR